MKHTNQVVLEALLSGDRTVDINASLVWMI